MERKKHNAEESLNLEEHDEVNEDEEALSLSNLPLIHQQDKEEQENTNSPHKEDQDFDFCSMFKESEMCSADEVFFKGQILPLRHSISFEQGFSLQEQLHKQKHTSSHQRSVIISRSASMDHNCHSRSLVSSSRSSSINSNSSSSTSNTTLPNKHYRSPKSPLLPRNQFVYNQPSPSPRFCSSQGITNSTSICKYENRLHSKKWPSSSWNVFKLGLVTVPPEILNARPCNNVNKNFGSRNSESSSNSCNDSVKKKKKKKKQMAGLFGGCKCSSSIDEVRDSRIAVTIKRSASENEVEALIDHREEEDDEIVMRRSLKMKKKHQLSHHRTFEWLKQLSIEGGNDDLS